MRPEFDAVDAEILKERERLFNAEQGPRVGDFLRMQDGTLRRFTHDWGEDIQTTVGPSHPCNGDASFFLSDGHASFSGSLDPAILKSKMRDSGEKLDGSFWFFHHNHYCAENGVYFKIPCRVFEFVPVSDRTFKVIEWTPKDWWLVEVTGKDGSYSPILNLCPEGDGSQPTYENQIFQAAKLLEKKGPKALENPHAMIGRDCNCGECFCCAAAFVLHQANLVVYA